MKLRIITEITSLFDLYCTVKDRTLDNRVIDFLQYTNDYASEEDRKVFEEILQRMFSENNPMPCDKIAQFLEVLIGRFERFVQYEQAKKNKSDTKD